MEYLYDDYCPQRSQCLTVLVLLAQPVCVSIVKQELFAFLD